MEQKTGLRIGKVVFGSPLLLSLRFETTPPSFSIIPGGSAVGSLGHGPVLSSHRSPDERFEVDGANAARQFLSAHKVPEEQIQIAWEAIALHTTPGVTQHMRPEVALLYSGVGLDVLGKGFDKFPSELREKIVARYPRKHFKEGFIQEYFAGFAHKPGTTYCTVKASICERLIPGYKAPDACDVIAASPFPDSE